MMRQNPRCSRFVIKPVCSVKKERARKEQLVNRCMENIAHLSALRADTVFLARRIKTAVSRRYAGARRRTRLFTLDALNTHLYGCNEAYRWNGK